MIGVRLRPREIQITGFAKAGKTWANNHVACQALQIIQFKCFKVKSKWVKKNIIILTAVKCLMPIHHKKTQSTQYKCAPVSFLSSFFKCEWYKITTSVTLCTIHVILSFYFTEIYTLANCLTHILTLTDNSIKKVPSLCILQLSKNTLRKDKMFMLRLQFSYKSRSHYVLLTEKLLKSQLKPTYRYTVLSNCTINTHTHATYGLDIAPERDFLCITTGQQQQEAEEILTLTLAQ